MSDLPVGYENPAMSTLINAMLDAGHKVVLYTTSFGLHDSVVYSAGDLTVCVAPRSPHPARSLFRSERQELVSLMMQYPADIVNAHWSYEFAWAAIDSSLPTLVTIRDHAWSVLMHKPDIYRFSRFIMNHYVLHRAPFLSVNSEYLLRRLPKKLKNRTKVIPNAFDPGIVSYYRAYGTRDNAIASVANGFGKLKNISTGLRAFAVLRKAYPDFMYKLIGVGMEPGGAAERYARAAGLAEGVEFVGKVPHSQALESVSRAKVLLHPSLEESFGMSILEAMLVGTPVVGGQHSGNVPSLLRSGSSGILCDVTDEEDIARSVMAIIRDPARAEELAGNAARYARENFAMEKVRASYISYFSEILSQRG